MSFLYDTLVQEFGKREIARVPVPDSGYDCIRFAKEWRADQWSSFQDDFC